MKICDSSLDRFRLVAILEGISLLVLILIAMPIKYFVNNPLPVKYVGWIHGVLFVFFLITLLLVWIEERWSFGKVLIAFISSLIPFAPFILEKKLRQEQV